nr:hypothetical protein [Bacteroidota bacterium]
TSRYKQTNQKSVSTLGNTTPGASNNDVSSTNSISNKEIISIAYKDAAQLDEDAKELKAKSDFAYAFAKQKVALAEEKSKESGQLMSASKSISNPVKRNESIAHADVLNKESVELANEAAAALSVAAFTEDDYSKKALQAKQAQQYAVELESAVNSKNPTEAIARLSIQKEKLQEKTEKNTNEIFASEARKNQINKEREAQKNKAKAIDYQEDASVLAFEIESAEKKISNSKNNTEKEVLLKDIAQKKSEKEAVENKALEFNSRAFKLEEEATILGIEAAFAENLNTEYKNGGGMAALNDQQKKEVKAWVLERPAAGSPNEASKLSEKNDGNSNTASSPVVVITPEVVAFQSITNRSETVGTANTGSTNAEIKTPGVIEVKAAEVKNTEVIASQSTDKSETVAAANTGITNVQGKAPESEKYVVSLIEPFDEEGDWNDYPATYQKQVLSINSISNEAEKLNTRGQVYEKWSESSAKDAEVRKGKLEGLKGKAKKQEEKLIETLQTRSRIKKIEAETMYAAADNARAVEKISDLAANSLLQEARASKPLTPAHHSFIHNGQAKEVYEKGIIRESEALALSEEVESIRESLSGISRPEEKEIQDELATILQKRAQEKEIEAYQAYANAGKAEFASNFSMINAKALEVVNVSDTEIQAFVLAEEADGYFDKAEALLLVADKSKDPIIQLKTLKEAKEFQELALKKQLASMEILELKPGSNALMAQDKQNNAKPVGPLASRGNSNVAKATELRKISIEERTKAGLLLAEANDAEIVADNLTANARNINNKNEKVEALARAKEFEQVAILKKEKSAVAFANAESYELEARKLEAANPGLNAQTAQTANTTTIITTTNNTKTENQSSSNINQQVQATSVSPSNKPVTSISTPTKDAAVNKDAAAISSALAELRKQASEEKAKAELLQSESKEAEIEANNLTAKALKINNKKEKAETFARAEEFDKVAMLKKENSEVAFANAESYELEARKLEAANPGLAAQSAQKANTGNQSASNVNQQVQAASVSPANKPETGTSSTIKESAVNKDAAAISSALAEFRKQASEEKAKAELLLSESKEAEIVSNDLTAKALRIKKKKEKAETLARAEEFEQVAMLKKENSEVAFANAESYELEASKLEKDSKAILAQTSQSKNTSQASRSMVPLPGSSSVTAGANNEIIPASTEKTATANNTAGVGLESVSNNNGIPKTLTNEVFDLSPTITYTASNPIPLDVNNPEGLVFKVQVGAFRNPIPQDMFAGFAPVMGETTAQGFTRYTAGMFRSFQPADQAKDEIRNLGYSDVFVVAFYNGKRISTGEAQAMIRNGEVPVSSGGTGGTFSQNINPANPVNNAALSSASAQNSNQGANNSLPQKTATAIDELPLIASQAGAAPFRELNKLSGLVYTVQVGVYAKPVPPTQLFNLQPLYVENTANGMMRYTTGVFDDVNKAVNAKNVVVNIGIRDAFVTAYYNGNRITVAEARNIEAQNSNVLVKGNLMNQQPFSGPMPVASTKIESSANVILPNAQTTVSGQASAAPVARPAMNVTVIEPLKPAPAVPSDFAAYQHKSKPGLSFKVQIGAFKDEVPIEIATKFLHISSYGITHYLNDQGLTIYSVGSFSTYSAAHALRHEIAESEGFNDAFVMPYLNENKIAIGEALELLKK